MPPRARPPAAPVRPAIPDLPLLEDLAQPPRVTMSVQATSGVLAVNRAAADRLFFEHRIVHRLFVRKDPPADESAASPEEKLLRAIFGERANAPGSDPHTDDTGLARPGETIARGAVV